MKHNHMDMDPIEIRVKFLRVGVSQLAIARKLGVTHTAIYLVIEGRSVSDRIRRGIAEAINLDVRVIWPSTYLYGGPRKAGRPKAA